MSAPDWYAVLGVARTATTAQIARAFRRAAFRWHPDRNAERSELAHRQFLLVQQAYETLGDLNTRSAYDAATAPPPPPDHVDATPPDRRPRDAAAPRPVAAKPPTIVSVASFVAWVPLWLGMKLAGLVLMVLLGPFADHGARENLNRRAPVFAAFVVPLGRVLVLAGVVLLMLSKWWRPLATPFVSVGLIVAGAAVLVVERVAVAAVWALGAGGRPKA